MNMSASSSKFFPREVRLGIVMYGGVSLAVYENGVAQELFRAVKGEGVYTFIKELIASDIVVDIISGTSAGGINGIFLGYALVNNRNFRECARLWREDGDILDLLRKPSDPNTLSLLDSRGYYQPHLENAFSGMGEYNSTGGIESEIVELDLFITGTNVRGHIYTEFDDQGHPVDVKNHRQVFLLSFRQGRKNEFEPGGEPALAKLARITSCFPVAFEPVRLPCAGDRGDELLQRWGKTPQETYYLDGGVLNNKPFSFTIDAIFHRTANREVDRMLLYVEPDPERFVEQGPGEAPNVLQAATDALLRIPGYQSIASDLDAIAEHNDRVARRNEIYSLIGRDSQPLVADCLDKTDASDFTALNGDSERRGVYLKCRLARLRDRAVEGILKRAGEKPQLTCSEREAAQILVQSFAKLSDESLDTLADFDVYYRLRRLFHLTYFVGDNLLYPANKKDAVPEATAGHYRDLLQRLNHQIKLLEMIQFAMESVIDYAPIPYTDLKNQAASAELAQGKWQAVLNLMRALLDPAGAAGIPALGGDVMDAGLKEWGQGTEKDRTGFERTQRKNFMSALRARIDLLSKRTGSEPVHPSGNLLQETDRLEREILHKLPEGSQNPVAQEYCRFLVIDSHLYPMQYMADMESTDVIRTVRISPVDARLGFSDESLDDKICGNELGHFGGFLKRSWRANDIMWGRLDAACQLSQCLITPERMRHLSAADLKPALDRDLPQLFPHSPAADLDKIKGEIGNLSGYVDAGNQAAFQNFLQLVILAAQREIVNEEVPTVLDAAIRQQADWNQYDLGTKPVLRPWSPKQGWTTGVRQLDRAVTTYAAARLTQDKSGSADWAQYFGQDYTVGRENWKADIPKPILLEIVITMALVLHNCLLGVAGPLAPKIRSSLVYKMVLDWPLRTGYHLIRLQRNAPEYVRLAFAALAAACISLLAVDVVLLLMGSQYRRPPLLWIGAPAGLLVLLFLLGMLLFRPRRR